MRITLALVAFLSLFTCDLSAAEVDLAPLKLEPLLHVSVGVTRQGTSIPAVITRDDLDLKTPKLRVLVLGGLTGSAKTTDAATQIMRQFYTDAAFAEVRKQLALSAVVCADPDGLARGGKNDDKHVPPSRGYPPQGESYRGETNVEAQYLWRWIGMHAPDLVIELAPSDDSQTVESLPPDALVRQLPLAKACNVGTIPARRWTVAAAEGNALESARKLIESLGAVASAAAKNASPARQELQTRVDRSPQQVCQQLTRAYGQDLSSVAYIPALALVGRVRYGELVDDPSQLVDVERIVAPYLSGAKPTLGERSGGSEFAGHLIFGTLADATKNKAYIPLVLNAANRGFDASGKPLAAMPSHSEMSDAVFMACPILAQAGRLTGDDKYFQMSLKHLQFMLKLNLRADGIHRHSPLDETAWGRGNGFPALGATLALDEFPAAHPGRDEFLSTLRNHLRALQKHQDVTGMWHQVVDHPESYREFTATSMITFAMIRGVRRGWLDRAEFEPSIQRAWYALKSRIGADGGLVDVCTGTGKQKSLREYYDRGAILGRDGRGGAMALMVSTEMLAWEK